MGVVVSSARYKRDIREMGNSTDSLMKLRPVTFVYKGDHEGVKQYGLVAEEVEQVYPELVVHDADGKIQSVRYSMLTSMLLNELQKQVKANRQQAEQIDRLNKQLADLKAGHDLQRTSFEERLTTLEDAMFAGGSPRNL